MNTSVFRCQDYDRSSSSMTARHLWSARSFGRIRAFVAVAFVLGATATANAADPAHAVVAEGCYLKIKQQASVPARDRGVLATLSVEPGQIVSEDQLLGSLETVEAELSLAGVQIELKIAEQELNDSLAVEIADANLQEAEALLAQEKVEREVANKLADSDVAIRIAENAVKLAQEELDRALAAREKFRSSVSTFEIMKHEITRDEKTLQVENAKHEQDVAHLKTDSRDVAIEQQQKVVARRKLEGRAVVSDRALAQLDIERLNKSVELAEERLRKREIHSPLPGLIVERLREPGEWVEPGEAVLRVVRLDRLLVEGFVLASEVDQSCVGRTVRVEVSVGNQTIEASGHVLFVSPEVDPVNMEVSVRAEVANDDLKLRPGQPASMTILPNGNGTAQAALKN